MSTAHDRVMAALQSTVARRLDEVEDWQHQQRIARAVLGALELRAEYAWAPDGDPPLLVPCSEELARRRSKQLGGSVAVREVTDWRAES